MTEEKDVIKNPLKKVFGLSRELNQSFNIQKLEWSGYTSFGMNLGEEQDNTYSVANCLADLWEKESNLPDLYIVHIAIGAQGVSKGLMWNPEYEKKLVPGKLKVVDISLLSFTEHILSMDKKSIEKLGKKEIYPLLHWRGGEEDFTVTSEELERNLKNNYTEILNRLNNAFGEKIPVYLHKLVCKDRCMDYDPEGKALEKMEFINNVFSELSAENDNISLFDVTKIPTFIKDVRGNGIFCDDAVHFKAEINKWVAEQITDKIKEELINK